jgi:membrane protein required for colicin V production
MSVADFNVFDWFLVLIVLFSMVMAFRRGLVRAIFGLLGFIGGFLLAAWNYGTVGDLIYASRLHVSTPMARIIAFILIVAIVAIGMGFVGRVLQKILSTVGLGWFDRTLGMTFGFARGCLLGLVALMATTTFAPQSGVLTTSVLTPYLFAAAHDVSFLVPQYLQQSMVNGAIDLKHGSPNWINRY